MKLIKKSAINGTVSIVDASDSEAKFLKSQGWSEVEGEVEEVKQPVIGIPHVKTRAELMAECDELGRVYKPRMTVAELTKLLEDKPELKVNPVIDYNETDDDIDIDL